MAFDWSKLGSLSVPLNVSATSSASSGILDNSTTNNESHTGAFVIGGSGNTVHDTTEGARVQGGSVPNSSVGNAQPLPGGAMPGVQLSSVLGNPIILGFLLIGAALLYKHGKF